MNLTAHPNEAVYLSTIVVKTIITVILNYVVILSCKTIKTKHINKPSSKKNPNSKEIVSLTLTKIGFLCLLLFIGVCLSFIFS